LLRFYLVTQAVLRVPGTYNYKTTPPRPVREAIDFKFGDPES
jgi:hypothetical protein